MPRSLAQRLERCANAPARAGRIGDTGGFKIEANPSNAAAMHVVERQTRSRFVDHRDATGARSELFDRIECARIVCAVHTGMHDDDAVEMQCLMKPAQLL